MAVDKIKSVKSSLEKAWRPFYIIPLLVAAAIAVFDAHAYRMFQKLENPGTVYQTIVTEYMQLFHGLVFTGITATALIVYYYRNLRDALAYLVFSLSVIWSGVWDLIYYQIPGTPVMPEELTHLNGTPVGTAATLFNNGTVTPEMVAVNAALFLVVGLGLAGVVRFSSKSDFLDKAPNW